MIKIDHASPALTALAAEIKSVGAHKTIDVNLPLNDPSHPLYRAPASAERIKAVAAKMAAGDKKISQPKEGSKEAALRALREERANVQDVGSTATYTRAAKAKGKPFTVDTSPTPDFSAAVMATTTEESSSMRTPKKAKTTQKPKGAAKAKKPTTERRKKPARATAPARKPAKAPTAVKTTPKAGDPTKGGKLIAWLRKDWTVSQTIQDELGWAPHTLRGFLSRIGQPVKDGGKGLKIERRTGDKGSEYRITN